MKINYRASILLMWVWLVYGQVGAQNINNRQHAISITILDENIGIPLDAFKINPKHPGATLSFESSKIHSKAYRFTHMIQLGYYYHADFNQVGFLGWKPKFELRLLGMVNVHVLFGLGYAHSFPTQQTYGLENEHYESKQSNGKSHFMPSAGFGGGLDFNKALGIPLEVFGRYEAFSLAPYAINGIAPVTVNTMISIGIKYVIKN
ncbi:MAG: hypothetical protein V3V00_00575 [Saprospiraceae bacterium]